MRPILAPSLALALAALTSLPGFAQSSDTPPNVRDMVAGFARLGGSMEAAAKVCGGYSLEQLAQSRQQQKAQLMKNGMSEAAFEQGFAAGLEEGQAHWDAMSASEREAACDELRQAAASVK
ncbi:hypothetical protein [Stutzerimonas urumqiensis]|uniref:hypothetical protein n=1 Tax=Stutzerimonas urumqiensis TaxID=638269 RepID=UPI000EB1A191|nr:hypothetical protein [Stutzerimonas urumqiensis]